MRRTILYYPNIVIPDGVWLRKSLLYWDEVSSIVPREWEYENWHKHYLLQYLQDSGEYRPIYPDQLMVHEIFKEFEQEIIRKGKYYLTRIKNQTRSRYVKPTTLNISEEDFYHIHRDKLTYRLTNVLGLEQHISNEDDWLLMEKPLADMYMATLAKYLALADVNYTVIGTDQTRTINKMYPSIRNPIKPFFSKIDPVFNLTINILPVPNPYTPYEEIIRFKRKYRDELYSFRKIINDFEQQVSNAESEHQLKEYTILFKEQIESGSRETMKMLEGSRITYLLSSLRSIINIKSPTILATIAGIAGQKMEVFPPSVVAGLVGAAGTVELAYNYMSIRKGTLEKLADKGFLYLHYARSKGIVQDFM